MFSDFSKTPLNREQHKKIVRIIHNLLNMNESVSFRKPVCYRALGLEDYKDVVKKPIDLNMVRRNNNEWVYKLVEEVFDDIQRCWDNCRIYNRPGSEIYESAVKMEENFVEEILKQYPSFVIPPGIIKGRQSFPEQNTTYEKLESKEKQIYSSNEGRNSNVQIFQQEDENGQYPRGQMELEEPGGFKKPVKKDISKQKVAEKPKEQQDIPVYEDEQQELQGSGSANQQAMIVEELEPIKIAFPQFASQTSVIALGQKIKAVRNQRDIIRGVLRIIQEDEKTQIEQVGQSQYKFKASRMKFATYVRINRFLDIATKM